MTKQEQIFPANSWTQLDFSVLSGMTVLLGGADSGKTALARWIAQNMVDCEQPAAWLDGDIGQSFLGLPGTMNMALVQEPLQMPPTVDFSFFIGSTNVQGRSLAMVTGVKRMAEAAANQGIRHLLVDTTGFIDKTSGGLDLKKWKLELLQPSNLICLQRGRELEPVVAPWRKHPDTQVIDLGLAAGTRKKTTQNRIQNRRKKLRVYFKHAKLICLSIPELPVQDLHQAHKYSLAGFLDRQGYCLALGVVLEHSRQQVRLMTPLKDWSRVYALRVGALKVDPVTGMEFK